MPSRGRNREQLIRDAVIAVHSELSYGSKFALLDNVCWTLSELEGKYAGCRFWSRRALDQRTDLRHEHSVPRRLLITMLLEMSAPTEAAVRCILDLCVGVVVTVEEDRALNAVGMRSRMPEGWDGRDVFARYRAVGIEVVDTLSVTALPSLDPRQR
jgi:hypothetical protein